MHVSRHEANMRSAKQQAQKKKIEAHHYRHPASVDFPSKCIVVTDYNAATAAKEEEAKNNM